MASLRHHFTITCLFVIGIIVLFRKGMKILTWNVWFDSLEMPRRTMAIVNILERIRPEVACFQEVTAPFLTKLLETPWIQREYICSDPMDCSTIGRYGVMMLTRKELAPMYTWVDFDMSRMGRKLLCAQISLPNEECLTVGTVHLESLNTQRVREAQLEICRDNLPRGKSVLVGDFNFCSERNYSGSLPLDNDCLEIILGPDKYEDLWAKLRPGEVGYTFDSERNKMLLKYEQARYDRIMTSLHESILTATSIELIGDKVIDKETCLEIENDEEVDPISDGFSTPPSKSMFVSVNHETDRSILPSDHFGLCANFEIR